MIFVTDIRDLQYYWQPADLPCYCEPVLKPSDILLQAPLPPHFHTSDLDVQMHVFGPDGVTPLYGGANAIGYFDWWIMRNSDGKYFINLRANWLIFGCILCSFVLKLRVWNTATLETYFEGWTEQYCIDTCCLQPAEITYEDV